MYGIFQKTITKYGTNDWRAGRYKRIGKLYNTRNEAQKALRSDLAPKYMGMKNKKYKYQIRKMQQVGTLKFKLL